MIEDRLLILRFKRGSRDALRRIYEKYRAYLLKIAVALLYDVGIAEDVVQDVFVRFAESESTIKLTGSLKAYLRTCVVNNARNKNRARRQHVAAGIGEAELMASDSERPDRWIICKEETERLSNALIQIPDDQREVVALRLVGHLKFRQIARLQGVSVETVQSRYRRGMDKVRSILNGQVIK